jgi:hypothetical protein
MSFHHSIERGPVNAGQTGRIGDVPVRFPDNVLKVFYLELGEDPLPGGVVVRIQHGPAQAQSSFGQRLRRVFMDKWDLLR